MNNENEKITYNVAKAEEYLGQFSKENLNKLKELADVLKNELEITKKLTDIEREQLYYIDEDLGQVIEYYRDSDYVLKPNFERTPISFTREELEKLIRKVGDAFRFFDLSTPEYNQYRDDNYIGITNKENFDFFYEQLNRYVGIQERGNETEFINNSIVFEGEKSFIPPDTLENEFCRAMYKLGKVNQPIEWYDIYEFIQGEQRERQEEHQTKWPKDFEPYYSSMRRVNAKVKSDLKIEELFTYKKSYFTRKR